MRLVPLYFKGPFRWWGPDGSSFFDRPEANLRGLYLYGIKRPGGYLVAGFGITRRTFASRFAFHTRSYFDGPYPAYDFPLLLGGCRKDVWQGFWWERDAWKNKAAHRRRLPSITQHAASLLMSLRIFVAPVTSRSRVLERIESAIYTELRARPMGAGLLVDDGMQVSPRRSGERPFRVKIRTPTRFLGLPSSFRA